MRILFIDDVREPTKGLRKAFGIPQDADVTWVTSLAEAFDQPLHGWDYIYFDHDLGGDDTTMPIAQRLAEFAFDGSVEPSKFATCVIHTSNPVGRQNLAMVLERWGYNVQHVVL